MGKPDVNLLRAISDDRAIGSAVLFSHRHPQQTPPFHVELLDLWRSADEFVLIEAFREAAKTTLSQEFLLMEGCYGNFNYCLLIGETYEKACQSLKSIDTDARMNVKLHRLFGGPVLARKSNENKMWFKSGAIIEALGWEQELQSFKEGTNRPDVAYLDDPENQMMVRDSASVDASMRKFWLELVPALDKTRRRIRLTQTRRARDCMVTRFADNQEWVVRQFPICNGNPEDPKTESIWPSRYPMDWIRKEYGMYKSSGQLAEFMQSYMLQVTNPDAKPFKDEHLSFMDTAPFGFMPKYAIYDPARTSDPKKSDEYGKVVVSKLGSRILVHESGGYNWKPSGLIEDLFRTQDRHNCVALGVEKNSLDEWLMEPLNMEMMRKGVSLPLKMLQAPQDRNKEQFILGLQPFFHAQDVVLIGGKSAHSKLCAEIVNFPEGSKNILNALAYSLRMFGGVAMYEDFGQENVKDAPEPRGREEVYVAINANPGEVVAAVLLHDRRHWMVALDYVAAGAVQDAIRTVVESVKADFPRATLQWWTPQDAHDQALRIPLVSALRAIGVIASRGEYSAVARGTLAERIRTTVRNRRLFTVDERAKVTLNAFAAGYQRAIEKGGRIAELPEQGTSRLVVEGIESMIAMLTKFDSNSMLKGAHESHNAQGQKYFTSLPK